eukprot:CAMPEP_0173392522 /NCGR_PEP_ID=MMETSP1356-20130122/19968_1 /TAXON_ID=77927 ORGANISM="Hemiselmis virescens, Strain PCC157" /NCGR_SAMPLE_ID=MMETSP1356 /ASSEMBLY_ACC=CAM_ASM_000847 /LENGTH=176 /DNA_ID=CAMNT_0014350337 /DNA_START=474 /DNA_END=1000 /DNA_ORIENTATION=-
MLPGIFGSAYALAKAGDDKAMAKLIALGPINGVNAAHSAAFCNDLGMLKRICDTPKAREWLTAQTEEGWTPLSLARSQGHRNVVIFLQKHRTLKPLNTARPVTAPAVLSPKASAMARAMADRQCASAPNVMLLVQEEEEESEGGKARAAREEQFRKEMQRKEEREEMLAERRAQAV